LSPSDPSVCVGGGRRRRRRRRRTAGGTVPQRRRPPLMVWCPSSPCGRRRRNQRDRWQGLPPVPPHYRGRAGGRGDPPVPSPRRGPPHGDCWGTTPPSDGGVPTSSPPASSSTSLPQEGRSIHTPQAGFNSALSQNAGSEPSMPRRPFARFCLFWLAGDATCNGTMAVRGTEVWMWVPHEIAPMMMMCMELNGIQQHNNRAELPTLVFLSGLEALIRCYAWRFIFMIG
jgi:hypothetical protein